MFRKNTLNITFTVQKVVLAHTDTPSCTIDVFKISLGVGRHYFVRIKNYSLAKTRIINMYITRKGKTNDSLSEYQIQYTNSDQKDVIYFIRNVMNPFCLQRLQSKE